MFQTTDDDVTNATRAAWAESALEAFTIRVHRGYRPQEMPAEDREDAIADLITDLLHLAMRYRREATAAAGCGESGPEGFRCTHHEDGMHVARGVNPDSFAETWPMDASVQTTTPTALLDRAGAMFLTECSEDP